ncbi:hypothetical protein EVD26_06715 [Brucella abortus]|nr:hypothetical protein DMP32_02840 [Brucella abortus]RUQ82342.1 hypothetical protein ELZ22_01250 [Brucella abortus]RUQ99482.1 hypothetical protein ELZ21_09040 [Brucella abortus]RYC16405.1 hypothetical protein EVD26_06715 [Brucella abortus]RYV40735.1 hypothetical protein EVD24_14100 [Brucella abortus]
MRCARPFSAFCWRCWSGSCFDRVARTALTICFYTLSDTSKRDRKSVLWTDFPLSSFAFLARNAKKNAALCARRLVSP